MNTLIWLVGLASSVASGNIGVALLEDLPRNIPAERLVLVQVVDERGQPVAGARAESYGAQTKESRSFGAVPGVDPAVSDADGLLSMTVPERFLALDVKILAQGFAGALFMELKPGAMRHKLIIPFGARVTGRIVKDGRPVAGSAVAVVQADRTGMRHFIYAVGDVTDADGRFAFTNLPADEDYAIFTPVGKGSQKAVLTTKKFKAPPSRKQRDLGDLSAIAPLRIAGRIDVAPEYALPADTRLILSRNPAWDSITVPVAKDGSFVAEGLPPESYTIHILAQGFKLDADRMPFQVLSNSSFGLRLKESLRDLHIVHQVEEPPDSRP